MIVAILKCGTCGDEWHIPDPDVVRNECRSCGERVTIEWEVDVEA